MKHLSDNELKIFCTKYQHPEWLLYHLAALRTISAQKIRMLALFWVQYSKFSILKIFKKQKKK